MSSILKKALIPAIIIEVFLLIFCQFVTEIDELSFTILIFGSPLWLFTALFAIFAYIDLKKAITQLHSDDDHDKEH